jgi:hypothetical protein
MTDHADRQVQEVLKEGAVLLAGPEQVSRDAE